MICDKPVNIKDMGQSCKGLCSYKYDYDLNSSVQVKSMKDHLVIKVDGSNKIVFNKYSLKLDQKEGDDKTNWDSWGAVKIFQPSIHLFDGNPADGEIIISQSGSNNRLFVCIPITLGEGTGVSNNFFSQIIPYISPVGTDSDVQHINVSKWSLNDVVPVGTFFFYNGNMPYQPCTKNVGARMNIIVFGLKSAARINQDDLTILRSLITPNIHNDNNHIDAMLSNGPLILTNKADVAGGGAMGPSTQGSEYVVMENCQYIDGIENENINVNKPSSDLSVWIIVLIIFMGLMIIFALIYTTRGRSDGSDGSD